MSNNFSNRRFHLYFLMKTRWLLVFSLLLLPIVGQAQCTDRTTMGRDFWLMFLENLGGRGSEYSLIAACDRGTLITVSNPTAHWDTVIRSIEGGSVRIDIPESVGLTSEMNSGTFVVSNGGIHVTATRPIALYASNFKQFSFDMATIYPTSTLRSRYITQTYLGTSYEEVGFVAVQDSTVLSMVFPANISPPLSAGPQSVTLMRGQTCQLQGYDISGIEVTSNDKPFAMFQGSQCTNVGGCMACDHLYEQSYPVDYWGNLFLLVSTATRFSGDHVQITSLEDNCTITFNGGTPINIPHAGDSYYYVLPANSSKLLRSSKPVSVTLYFKGQNCGNDNGDPASVIIPPVEQGVSSTVFQAYNTQVTTEHYSNIVAPNSAVPYMKIDSVSISDQFVMLTNGYAYSRLPVSPGTHRLSCDSGSFVAYFYGLGYYESYAYIAGSSIVDLSEKLFVDGHYTRTHTGSFDYCLGDTVSLWIESDEEDLLAIWYVDSVWADATIDGFHCAFDTPGDHLVEALVHFCDTLSAIIHVNPAPLNVSTDTLCFGQTYHWQGRTIDTTGIYFDTLETTFGCDSVLELDLTLVPRHEVAILRNIDCHEATYSLTADIHEVEGWPFSWSSDPHDHKLDGHEHDTLVYIMPRTSTRYTLDIDYTCPFSESVTLSPVEWAGASWLINPEFLSYDHPWFDAYDLSHNVIDRQWFVNQIPQQETSDHLHYYASIYDDSVDVMLVLNSSTCPDTLQRSLPISHAAPWVPNVFTPNAETNSRFAVTLSEGVAEELYIYNRNGLLVSYIEGPTPEWDGTHDGVACPQGAYVWLLRYHTVDRPDYHISLTGTVTLLR